MAPKKPKPSKGATTCKSATGAAGSAASASGSQGQAKRDRQLKKEDSDIFVDNFIENSHRVEHIPASIWEGRRVAKNQSLRDLVKVANKHKEIRMDRQNQKRGHSAFEKLEFNSASIADLLEPPSEDGTFDA